MTSILRGMAALAFVAAALCVPAVHAAKPAWGPDAAGGSDHPLIKRFRGSWLIGYKVTDWDQTTMPIGMKVDDRHWMQTVGVEGKITRLLYLAPPGKSRLEVYRNYEQALMAAGLKRKFACERECADMYFALDNSTAYRKGLRWASGQIPQASGSGTYSLESALSYGDGRFLYGTLNRGGQELHVLLYNAVAANDTTDTTITYLEIVEPKAMQTGQVTVNADAMQTTLASEGKIALYGIYFDTGRAEIKPESKAQLDEMAKLLLGQPALKVFIVGHTDNQGALDANLALSQQRAAAVSTALVSGYKIDAKRLLAKGVASLAPTASNANDDGRARNRRVELVVQ